ncbi:MAG: hypothetical protein M1820_008811 [Bogoriella megaspora]|nr:MAG: hypothetical protein M1820_008811 [Bogoriella megaspora]
MAPSATESFEQRQERIEAAKVVESNERLIWYSTMRNESVPQTRLHFLRVLAGIDESTSPVQWADDFHEAGDGSDQSKAKGESSSRQSLGSGNAGPSSATARASTASSNPRVPS